MKDTEKELVCSLIDNTLLDAPCLFCGYSGPGYYRSGTHHHKCPWNVIGGEQERIDSFPNLILKWWNYYNS